MAGWWRSRFQPFAETYRQQLEAQYGKERGGKVEYAEGIEICPFGSPLDAETRQRLLPFLA